MAETLSQAHHKLCKVSIVRILLLLRCSYIKLIGCPKEERLTSRTCQGRSPFVVVGELMFGLPTAQDVEPV